MTPPRSGFAAPPRGGAASGLAKPDPRRLQSWACAFAMCLGVAAAPAWADIEATMTKAGCLACHTKDKKVVGPAYKDVAAKYKGQADAPAKLAEKVRKGSTGVWGPVPMPPTGPDKISDADLKAAIELVLKS